MTVEDAALVRLARAGDRDAFAALVDRHQTAAWRVAMAALGRPDEADDAAQEAFIAAWQRLDALSDEGRFRPWLLSIAWRKALDRRRGLRAWLRAVSQPAGSDERPLWTIEDSPDLSPSPEDVLLSHRAAASTRRMIAALPRKLRDPLLLAASGEYRYEEIAEILGAPVGTI